MSSGPQRHFSESYGEARKKFIDAAKDAGASLETHQNTNANGPRGEPLYTDVARLGPPPEDTIAVLFLTSGTHGIEGYCGSGCQIGALREDVLVDLPDRTAVVITHAINPYGFCWGRRVNEDNIDLNRNHVDHEGPYPDDTAYGGVHEMICPPDLIARKEEWDAKAFAWIDEHGMPAFQAAVSSGQYSHPDGLFYGGAASAWSNEMWRSILNQHGQGAERAVFIDFHTGLGPSGYGEMIGLGGSECVEIGRSIWGDENVTDMHDGSSTSAVVRGDMSTPYFDLMDGKWAAGIALEYGTLDVITVLDGLRKDNWLYLHGDRDSELGQEIVANTRACFYTETDEWKAQVFDRAVFTVERALAALPG